MMSSDGSTPRESLPAPSFAELLASAKEIGAGVAAQHAADVDARARFPREAVDAMRRARLLSASVPLELGGSGCGLHQLAQLVGVLAPGCSAAAMVLAMHYSQVACLTRRVTESPLLTRRVRELCDAQHLLASITSEVGTFGDTRTSVCALERHDDSFTLEKEATTGSYCAHADVLVVTCRKHAQAASNDQCLVYVRREDATLEQTTTWDTLGMRGTVSPGYRLRASGPLGQVHPVDYAEISAAAMVPASHVLWAALWTGIAQGAYTRAAHYVRALARKQPGTVPAGAERLAALQTDLQAMRLHVLATASAYDALVAEGDRYEDHGRLLWTLKLNGLKVSISERAPQIVIGALQIVGIQGYKNDGPYAMGRPLRDVLSGSLMVSNARIAAHSAALLLVNKDDGGFA